MYIYIAKNNCILLLALVWITAWPIMVKSKMLVMFKEQNWSQHRLNCVLSWAHTVRQLLKLPMAVTLPQDTIRKSSWMATSSYHLKMFWATDEWYFFLGVGGQRSVLWDTQASDSCGLCHSLNQHAAGRAHQPLAGICWDPWLSIIPALGSVGGLHEPQQWTIPDSAQSQDSNGSQLSVLCGCHWLHERCSPDERGSYPRFSLGNPDQYKPNGLQHRCCHRSLRWLLCHLNLRCRFSDFSI